MKPRIPIIGTLENVLIGKAVPYKRPNSFSAINKLPIPHIIKATSLGLVGDEQGDLRVHGGVDKAIHCYPVEHYHHYWQEEMPDCPQAFIAGAFGENFSTRDLTEETVCIGDQWQIGTAIFEVSQGRQPCWKLNERFQYPLMAKKVQESLRTGWYCRVLTEGEVKADDKIYLLHRPFPDWPIARIAAAIRDRSCDQALIQSLLAIGPLAASWKTLFTRRLETRTTEDWHKRLQGPTT